MRNPAKDHQHLHHGFASGKGVEGLRGRGGYSTPLRPR